MRDARPPWELPDQVHLPDGRKFSGTRARVYWLMRLTAEREHRHPMETVTQELGPPGWTPIHTLRRPWAGGASGDRRARELRETYGVEIEIRDWTDLGGPEDSDTTLYRITEDPIARGTTPPAPPTDKKATPIRRHPLAGIRFRTCIGKPAGAAKALRVDPGFQHVLSPSLEVSRRIRSMDDLDAGLECYREELRERWRSSAATWERELTGMNELVLWCTSDDRWSPFPVLIDVLTALGAEYAGEWEEVAA